jgi:long-chain acyl-CoA synthetase
MGMHESGNLGDIFPAGVDPRKPALIVAHTPESETVISYGALWAQSQAVARGLVRAGYGRGDRIAIMAANVTDYLATYFGTMQAGCISVPVNWKLPESALHHVLQDSDAKMIFADTERLALIPAEYKPIKPSWTRARSSPR